MKRAPPLRTFTLSQGVAIPSDRPRWFPHRCRLSHIGVVTELLKTLPSAAQPGRADRRVRRTFCVQNRARAGTSSEAMSRHFQCTKGVAAGYLVPGVGGQMGSKVHPIAPIRGIPSPQIFKPEDPWLGAEPHLRSTTTARFTARTRTGLRQLSASFSFNNDHYDDVKLVGNIIAEFVYQDSLPSPGHQFTPG